MEEEGEDAGRRRERGIGWRKREQASGGKKERAEAASQRRREDGKEDEARHQQGPDLSLERATPPRLTSCWL